MFVRVAFRFSIKVTRVTDFDFFVCFGEFSANSSNTRTNNAGSLPNSISF